MRNLKKILALVLALVMTFSVMSVSSAAFKDEAQINDIYAESAEVLAGLGVFKGYEDGSFNPKGSITRAEVAAIIYRVATGDVSDKQVGIYADYNVFSDVKSTSWYAGYVNYCANANYIKGYGNGKFGPNDTVTGYQALAMILRAVGYDKNGEFTGASWQVETAKIGNQLKITRNVSAGTLGTAATREVVAEILFRAISEAPTVTYSLGLGYSQFKNALTTREYNPTLGELNFNLTLVDGVVTAAGTGYVVVTDGKNADGKVYTNALTWEDIGYGVYFWGTPVYANQTHKGYNAVSSAYVYGVEVGQSTGGTAFAKLDAKYGDVGVTRLFYNGVELFKDKAEKVADGLGGTKLMTWDDATALVNTVDYGVKVSFIDNDGANKAEVAVITDYTAAYVSAIVNDKNTGLNGIVANCHYFMGTDGNSVVETKNLNCADTLVVGDLVTYVDYNGVRYAVKAPYAMGQFLKINYAALSQDISYQIGETTYTKAADFQKDATLLSTANTGRYLNVATDPYGYMLEVTPYAAPAQYLYVIAHNHSDKLNGLTSARVAFADGTISVVDVAVSSTGAANRFADFDGHMYTYTLKDGVYYLNLADCDDVWGTKYDSASMDHFGYYVGDTLYGVDYDNDGDLDNAFAYNTELTNGVSTYYFTRSSVVVDLRSYATTGVKIYNGYTEIPSISNGEWSFAYDARNFITVAFLTAGWNYNNNAKDVVLYTTNYTSYNWVSDLNSNVYHVPAIVDGKYEVLAVDAETYEMIKTLGVGHYELVVDEYFVEGGRYYYYSDVVNYTSFVENWHDVNWKDGTIVVDGVGSFPYGDDVNFYTIDITNGKYYTAVPTIGADWENAHAYLINYFGTAVDIYIVVGKLAPIADDFANYTAVVDDGFYYAAPGFVTNYVTVDQYIDTLTFLDTLDVINAAVAAHTVALDILDAAGVKYAAETEIEAVEGTKVADVLAKDEAGEYLTRVEYALDLLKAALEDITEALAVIEDLDLNNTVVDAEALAEVVETAEEAVEALEEKIEAVLADETYNEIVEDAKQDAADKADLKDLQDAKIKAVKAALVAEIKAQGEGVYFLGTDVEIADVADVYFVESDVKFVIEDAEGKKTETSLADVIASWTALIQAATTETAINAAVTKSMISEIAGAFVEFCKDLL